MMHELVIRNARVADGTGAPWFRADVAVSGGRISAVGHVAKADAERSIDADGLMLAPGFIEVHSHSDATLLINPRAESSIRQGVTTECTGNCGFSIFPVNQGNREQVGGLFEAFVAGYDVDWNDLEGLKARYEAPGCAVNVVPLVGHSTIRQAVMGAAMRTSSPEERRDMRAFAAEAMRQGARGLSTGLEYPPGSAADTAELIEVTEAIRAHGGLYATHIRNRDVRYLEAIDEAIEVAREAGVALQISHNVAKIGAPEGTMEKMLERVMAARGAGLDVAFDVGAYLGGQTTPLGTLPPWAFEGGPAETLKRLKDPEARERMKAYEYPIWRLVKLGLWENVRLAASRANPQLIGRTYGEIAREQGKEPWDVLFDLLVDEGAEFWSLLWEGEIYLPEDRDLMMRHALASFCCDGRTLAPYGPLAASGGYHHVYSWIPYIIRHHVRERSLIGLEEAIRKVTSASAARLGLFDRGVVRAGLAADLVLFDPEAIRDRGTLTDPHQYPEGIAHVFVNGRHVLRDGEHTGSLAGQVLTWS